MLCIRLGTQIGTGDTIKMCYRKQAQVLGGHYYLKNSRRLWILSYDKYLLNSRWRISQNLRPCLGSIFETNFEPQIYPYFSSLPELILHTLNTCLV